MSIPLVETSFLSTLGAVATDIESLLDRLQAQGRAEGEIARPDRLLEAMRFASLGGGKRVRPFLVVATAALFGVPRERALMAGAALECIHCYSLVHDDLPAMDNDDMRRGRPTAHKKFDEATAILAGDSLLTFAFDILARPDTHPDPAVRIELVTALARASGIGGMAGGQMLDLAAEGRFAGGKPQQLAENEIATLQAMKTGALAAFACRPVRSSARPRPRNAKPWRIMAARSVRRFRSPTIFSMSRATRRRSASRPERMPPLARRHSSGCSASSARGRGLLRWSPPPKKRWNRLANRQAC